VASGVKFDRRLSRRGRILLAAIGLGAVSLLFTARRLTPDPRGYGTHEQLGLAPCGFARMTGMACPTCGTTTAWSHTLRGYVPAALSANAGGTVLCGLAIVAAPWALASAAAGRSLLGRPTAKGLLIVGSAWLAVTLLDWAQRLASG
jgi:hypothetical protein